MEIKNILRKNKKGAMEMSVGTIVTIVLLMSVLVLGIFLVQNIFSTGTSAIDSVDQQIQNEIKNMFSSEEGLRVATIPKRSFTMKQGESGGFALSIRNNRDDTETFSYNIVSRGATCDISDEKAEELIAIGKEDEGIELASGQSLDGIFVRLDIPEDFPLCDIEYRIEVRDSEGEPYDTTFVGVEIE